MVSPKLCTKQVYRNSQQGRILDEISQTDRGQVARPAWAAVTEPRGGSLAWVAGETRAVWAQGWTARRHHHITDPLKGPPRSQICCPSSISQQDGPVVGEETRSDKLGHTLSCLPLRAQSPARKPFPSPRGACLPFPTRWSAAFRSLLLVFVIPLGRALLAI